MASAYEAAAAAAARMLAPQESDEAPEDAPVSSEEPAAEVEETTHDAGSFSFGEELPDDLLAELDLDEDDLDMPSDVEEDDDDDEDFEVDSKLKRELAKARREAEHYKQLRIKSARPKWEEEAKKYFPLSETVLSNIEADSRRAFLRKAREAHETVKPFVERHLASITQAAEAERERIREEERERAREQWGVTEVDAPQPPSEAEQQARIERARRTGDLADTIKAMVFPPRS